MGKKNYPQLDEFELETKVNDIISNYISQNRERDLIEKDNELFNRALDIENWSLYLDNLN